MGKFKLSPTVLSDQWPGILRSVRTRVQARRVEGSKPSQRHLEIIPAISGARALSRFGRMRSLQKFASIHSSVYDHFNFERHINTGIRLKQKRDAALRVWRDLLVA